ncbi:MAG: hypothetical protein COU72_01815 [Parcubacteria group bacterium CG10_big_fil_rev_8_21_14_0_10_41_35]|nr:MAG: hypothetical protein COU72_01815 [Parcubacteria group bacterium CG10_big_fil_rev_8_21_14_0_10_41_35]
MEPVFDAPPRKITPHLWERGGGITIRIRAKEKNEASEQKVKKTIKTLSKTALALLGINGALWLLDKARGDVRGSDETTVLNRDPYEKQVADFNANTKSLYSAEGMESNQLGIAGINSLNHLNEASYSLYGTPVFNLTAETGGPSWLFAYAENENGEVIIQNEQPVISQAAFRNLVDQLGLQNNPQGQQTLRENWLAAHDDPQVAFNIINGSLIPGASAHPQVTSFYQCSVDVFDKDADKGTWQDRLPGVEACAVKAKNVPTPTPEHLPMNNEGKNGLAAPVEQGGDKGSLDIAANIAKDGIHAGREVVDTLVNPIMQIAKELVVNHQLPCPDDIQGYWNAAIEGGDQLLGYIKQLPGETREAVMQQIHQWRAEREQQPAVLPADHIYDSPVDAINHLTGGGGWPMLVILGIECGLVAISCGRYLKRAKEMRNIPLPSPEEMRNSAIDFWLKEKSGRGKALRRGLSGSHLRVGMLRSSGLFEIGSEEVLAEVFMDADLVRTESGLYQDLASVLKHGVNQSVIDVLDNRNLLITHSTKGKTLKVTAIRASDLVNVANELARQKQLNGRTLKGEVIWYGGEQADYRVRKPAVIKMQTGVMVGTPRTSEATPQ